MANIATIIMATMMSLTSFPVSGGGACLSVVALYKSNVTFGLVN